MRLTPAIRPGQIANALADTTDGRRVLCLKHLAKRQFAGTLLSQDATNLGDYGWQCADCSLDGHTGQP